MSLILNIIKYSKLKFFLNIVLEEELATGLRLLGVTDISQLNPSMVRYLDRKLS